MSFDITGKVALITGANRGIGKSIVESFVKNGVAKVYAAVRTPDSVATLVESYGEKVVPLKIDLGDPATITEAANIATDVEVVVNNAGVLRTATPMSSEAIDALEFEMEINVYGLIRMAQAFGPVLKANGGGALVQLNSVASIKTFVDFSTYSASKAAAYAITQGLREELEEQGTLVVSVHPGPISTEMAEDAGIADMAEPPSLVADGIIAALKAADFHHFPDSMARQIGGVYEHFAVNIVEAKLTEG